MTLETIEIETGPAVRSAVIWLHGLGADGNDFVPVIPELGLDTDRIGNVRFVFPHAPMIPVTINGGYRMRAWYDILGTDLARREDESGLRDSQRQVEALIVAQENLGISSERIVLAGFSQGCAMTLMTGLRYPRRLAGLLGLSGYLPLADRLQAERHKANADVPVFLAHGSEDPMVPMVRAIAARDQLLSLGYPVAWRDYPMPHSVCMEELADIGQFFHQILTPVPQ